MIAPTAPLPATDRRATACICIGLFAWVMLVFSGVWQAPFITLDDPDHVYENAIVRGGLTGEGVVAAFREPHACLWVPLTIVSLMADVSLFGMSAPAMHVENIAWHAGAAVLLLLALRRATGRLWPAAAVAMLFALHPINVESVAWVTERKNVLCAFWTMATLWLWFGWVQLGGRWRYLAALGTFALALLAKPMAVPLPAALVLLDAWPLRRAAWSRWRQLALEKAPFLLLSLAASRAAMWAAGTAKVSFADVSLEARVTNALISFANYVRQLVWPSDFAVPYPHPGLAQWPAAALAGGLLAAITFLAWRQWKDRPWLLVGWLFFLGMLVPSSGIIQVGAQARADRFTYLAQIGVFVAMVWTLAELPVRRWSPRWRPLVGVGSAAVLSILTHAQACLWSDSLHLYQHSLTVTGPNPLLHKYLATVHCLRREPEKAVTLLMESVRLWPGYADAWQHLGRVLSSLDRVAPAQIALEKAAALDPADPDTQVALALVHEKAGNADASARHSLQALKLEPGRKLPSVLQARLRSSPPAASTGG
jgi:protein O-mannosyl-transferase